MTNSILGVRVSMGNGFAVEIKEIAKDDQDAFLQRCDGFQKITVVIDLKQGTAIPCRYGSSIDDAQDAKDSFLRAARFVSWLEGTERKDPTVLAIRTVEQCFGMYPKMEGGSMFGPTVMLLMKNAVEGRPLGSQFGWPGAAERAIRAVQLNRMAVSADFDCATGRFAKIGIAHKIEALERLKPPPAILIVPAENHGAQSTKFKVCPCATAFEAYQTLFLQQSRATLFPARRK